MVPRRMFEWGWGSAAAVWAMQWMGHKSLCCPPPPVAEQLTIFMLGIYLQCSLIFLDLCVCVCACV